EAKKDEWSPITDRISHVFLYTYVPDENPRPGTFLDISRTHLPALIAGTGAPAGGAAGSGEPTLGGNALAMGGRDSWKPLLGSGGGAAGAPGGGDFAAQNSRGGKFGGPGGFGVVSDSGGGEGNTGGGAPRPTGTNARERKGKPRYEFT